VAGGPHATAAFLEAIRLRGGMHGSLVDKDIANAVMAEVTERYFAGVAAQLGPKIDAADKEARTVIDEELAQACADVKADSRL